MIASITGGLGGRFFSRVRGEANLAYTVFSLNLLMPSGGGLLVYTAMSPENERKAWDLLQDEMKKIVNNGFTQKEWDRARNHLSAQYRARLEDDADLAEEILIHWNFGRDFVDYPTYKATLDGITLEDLKATAANVFLVERSRRGIYRGRILH
jgi:predicted Zn-dependent peptidase